MRASRESMRLDFSKNFMPPPRMMSTVLRYWGAMRCSSPLPEVTAAKPAGVAWVTVAVVTRPVRRPRRLRRRMTGSDWVPSGRMLMEPLLTFVPPPHAEDAAAESVT